MLPTNRLKIGIASVSQKNINSKIYIKHIRIYTPFGTLLAHFFKTYLSIF
nr:MAG TPA: hypothetical protein [Caudoviricetes sp.]